MSAADEAISTQDLIARRSRLLGPAYRLFYDQPVQFVRGEGVWLYDAAGHRYLDAYNNVASVGHCHPHVVQAIARQAAVLNTHTRYLHETVLDFAEKLLATFPPEIGHVMFTCTGSEANDLALRVARTCTGGTGFIVTANAYHGVTSALTELSPSLGLPLPEGSHVRLVPAPGSAASAPARCFARHVSDCAGRHEEDAASGLRRFWSIPSFPATACSPIPPAFCARRSKPSGQKARCSSPTRCNPASAAAANRCGALPATASCPISSPWANRWATAIRLPGWPRVPELLAEFGRRSRYFNTFGGNPVSAAAGIAVLDVIESEGLDAERATHRRLSGQIARAATGATSIDRGNPRRRAFRRRRAAARRTNGSACHSGGRADREPAA